MNRIEDGSGRNSPSAPVGIRSRWARNRRRCDKVGSRPMVKMVSRGISRGPGSEQKILGRGSGPTERKGSGMGVWSNNALADKHDRTARCHPVRRDFAKASSQSGVLLKTSQSISTAHLNGNMPWRAACTARYKNSHSGVMAKAGTPRKGIEMASAHTWSRRRRSLGPPDCNPQ